ncbi:MAG: glutaminyl-peptide cyclotransferase [Caldilineaceae bacterium]|nr:glutaminyl-peptide cyclotransferase [Caldilineaceae bacterium]
MVGRLIPFIYQQRVPQETQDRGRSPARQRAWLRLLFGIAFLLVSGCGTDRPTPTPQPPSASPTASPPPPTLTQAATVSPLPTPVAAFVSPLLPTPAIAPAPRRYTYEVVQSFPHDPQAFTQGLLFDEGLLYEGTGLYGRSSLRRVDLTSGTVLTTVTLPERFFGEGITIVGDQLYQLTWREQTGFIYDKTTFKLLQEFTYPTEGWGITFDGTRLIMSDGTARLYFWDPVTLADVGFLDVYDDQGPVTQLNELEYIEGEIFANIWQTDRIARIDPSSGAVVGWIDLTGLLPEAERTVATDVLNGIAYLPAEKQLFVTGKLWPRLFEIRLIPQD